MKRRKNFLLVVLLFSFVLCSFQLFNYQCNSVQEISPHGLNITADTKSNFNSEKSRSNLSNGADKCSVNITLPLFDHTHSESYQVFFLETSGKSYIKGRQVCSVESAAISSGLISKVILRSAYLDLSKSRSLCDVYYRYTNVQFYTIDYEELFRNTPAVGMTSELDQVVEHGITHYSDIGRLALVYKYGGFYLDLDMIIIKNLRGLNNFVVIETGVTKPDSSCNIPYGAQNGHWINNGHFHFEPHHKFPFKYMLYVKYTYNVSISDRHQAGPKVAWEVARYMYGLNTLTNQVLGAGLVHSQMSILPDFTFLPVDFLDIGKELYPETSKTPQQWNELFKCSYAVHFYSNLWGYKNVSGDPGRDAYSYLGPTHCPLSFIHHKEEF